MKNQTDHEMRYYPIESLALTDDVPGARQWAVALDQTMLNAPHAVFTGQAAVKAVDAWSPVMAKYRQGGAECQSTSS